MARERIIGAADEQHGRRDTRAQLLERATGRALDPTFYIEHLTKKYSDIYGI